jgi:AcrR family transcriptional regulator
MARPAVHSVDSMLDAARAVLFRAGIENTTVQAIAEACGAPVGSLYNRFASRRELLAQLWLRAAVRSQAACLPAFEAQEDALEAAVDAARRLVAFTRAEPEDARLLASFRREELIGGELAPELARELDALNRPLEFAIKQLSKRLYGSARGEGLRRVLLAVVDLPLAAVRRYLLLGRSVPADVDAHLERAVRAVLSQA